jgi:hypothetical protein
MSIKVAYQQRIKILALEVTRLNFGSASPRFVEADHPSPRLRHLCSVLFLGPVSFDHSLLVLLSSFSAHSSFSRTSTRHLVSEI